MVMFRILTSTATAAGVLVCFGYTCVVEVMKFEGPSMQPTIVNGDVGFCQKISTLPKEYQSLKKGDIVIAVSPKDPSMRICKRIIGVGGDEISSQKSTLEDIFGLGKRQFVPRGHVWLEGDNSRFSLDSRSYGPLPMGLVTSILRFKLNISDFTFKRM